MALHHRVLTFLRSRMAGDLPPFRLVFWDGSAFDFARSPSVTITFRSRRLLKLLLRGDFGGLGDAYVAGDLTVDGPVEDVIRYGIAMAERLGKSSAVNGLARLAKVFPRRHSRRQDAADIGFHYDVGNDFYRLWLDDNMIYSCAYFRDGREDIDKAQRRKLDHICRKLMLKPGDHLLDIGCGWGGLLHWAAKNYGVTGVGVTLSARQQAYAKAWMVADRLDDKVDIRLQDYRDLKGTEQFDKIVSVGMYEHVGLANLPRYFEIVQRQLRPGGAFLNHGIFATDPAGRAQGPAGGEFIDRYVFPGGAVPHLSRAIYHVAAAGLEFADAEDLRPHYARTLQHWTRRLEARREDVIRAGGIKRYRIWRVYLAGMAHAFDRGWLSVAQILAFKPADLGVAPRPWTRNYQYREATGPLAATGIPIAGPLDWTVSESPLQPQIEGDDDTREHRRRVKAHDRN